MVLLKKDFLFSDVNKIKGVGHKYQNILKKGTLTKLKI